MIRPFSKIIDFLLRQRNARLNCIQERGASQVFTSFPDFENLPALFCIKKALNLHLSLSLGADENTCQ